MLTFRDPPFLLENTIKIQQQLNTTQHVNMQLPNIIIKCESSISPVTMSLIVEEPCLCIVSWNKDELATALESLETL